MTLWCSRPAPATKTTSVPAAETIEGVRIIKEALPNTKTVLGISNVSFGLPAAGREVFNSVFLYHCTQAGLDMAIVNSEMMQRYATIPEEERRLSEDLIWNRGDDPVAAFAAHFRDPRPPAPPPRNVPPCPWTNGWPSASSKAARKA